MSIEHTVFFGSGKILIRILRFVVVSSRTMNCELRRSLSFARAILVLAMFVVCGLMAEQRCEASCGDYLVHRGVPSHSTLIRTGLPDSPQDVPAGPCRGANCSRRSESPPLPTRPTTVESSSVEWLCVIVQIRDQDDESKAWSLESDSLMARHTSQLLDRPPRG